MSFDRSQRREFITLLGGTVAAWPLTARAQQAGMPVVGSLAAVTESEWASRMVDFRRGLADAGYVEGRNVGIEYRWADNHSDRLPALAADLIKRKVSAIFTSGSTVGLRAAMSATKSIPIVFVTGGDPVAAGYVASLNRPGGNVTGLSLMNTELQPKRLELIREIIPSASKIALLVNPSNPTVLQADIQIVTPAARRLGLDLVVVNASSESEIEHAFTTASQERAAAVLEGADAFFIDRRDQIASLGVRYAMPTLTADRESVAGGVLMEYGAKRSDIYRQAGIYVGRILKGERPGDLPVQQPTTFELIINRKTAKAIGLAIPESFLARADEVIE
jgi:putative tryptophan/tyrosine transport system substrate-binding protein